MDRRQFIAGSSALALASTFPATNADAFIGCLLRALVRSSGGRHMLRFGLRNAGKRLRFVGRSGSRAQYIGKRGYEVRRRKQAKEVLVTSRNARLFKEVGELVLDNVGKGFPDPLNSNITVCGGGYKDEVYCGTFTDLKGNGKPVIMEICELQMLDEVGKHLPQLYRSDFFSDDKAASNREILSFIHPIAHIKDGEFEDEWNHITPLIYETARGRVIMDMMETEGKCIIEPKDSRDSYVIPIRWSRVNIQTGARG